MSSKVITLLAPGPAATSRDASMRLSEGERNLAIGLSSAGTVLGAYHGYKRNDSVGWAIAWAILGGAFPVITIPIALAQGFGQKAK